MVGERSFLFFTVCPHSVIKDNNLRKINNKINIEWSAFLLETTVEANYLNFLGTGKPTVSSDEKIRGAILGNNLAVR